MLAGPLVPTLDVEGGFVYVKEKVPYNSTGQLCVRVTT